jgi:hypothetical protein
MAIPKVATRLGGLVTMLAKDPGQVQYLPAWREALRRPTVESRLPWLPFRVIDRLQDHLVAGSRVFEFGGGGSTLWFADRGAQVVTVEHDDEWYPILADAVGEQPGVSVMHRSSDNAFETYVTSINEHPDESFDVVVVDGRERVRCFVEAMPKVRRGGLLILDDSDRARYAGAHEVARAWPSTTYAGLTPSKAIPGTTTIWTRPV